MQYQLIFVRNANGQQYTGGVTLDAADLPHIPTVGEFVEFAVDGEPNTVSGGAVLSVNYSYQVAAQGMIVVSFTTQ